MMKKLERGYMTASEAVAVFKQGLNDELGVASAGRYDPEPKVDERTSRVFSAMYRIAASLAPDATEAPLALLEENTLEFSEQDRRAVVLMLQAYAPHRSARTLARSVLQGLGATLTGPVMSDAGVRLLLGRAEAQARLRLGEHPEVMDRGDPLAALLDDVLIARLRAAEREPAIRTATTAETNMSPFLIADTRRLAEVIDPIVADIQASGDWNEDVKQRKTAIRAFAWSTGNKRLCDYGPADAQHFAATLRGLPTEFRWGTFEEGNMSRPFADVITEVTIKAGTKRNDRTVNRDLTTLSRFSRELAKTAWKPRFGRDLIVDFTEFASGTPIDDPDDPDRMPWTEEHLRILFSSSIYTGGGACMRRLKSHDSPMVWHDAAYWVPLLLCYGVLSREEACGVECEDFVFDVETPFVAIVVNMTKSKDGKTPAGLKRPSRRRMVPLHPELLRLGLREYITAVEIDGHRSAFPELYQKGMVNVGGKRFYASAGRYQLDHVEGICPLPRTSSGKRADLHSLRTTGGSALEDSEAKQLQVNDIMGHAREGTGPRKYSKAWFMKGGAPILAKRLLTMKVALPVVTDHLTPQPVRLLPVPERSRTGSAKGCATRRKG